MNNYNHQYYLCDKPSHETLLELTPTKATGDRPYSYEKLILGQKPLFFKNAFSNDDKTNNKERLLTDVLFDGSSCFVSSSIRKKLERYNTNNFQYYPTVFIDDKDNWHENYWLINLYDEIDCLDRKLSKHIDFGDEFEDDELAIITYVLNNDVLDTIEESNRLIFKIAGTTTEQIFIHQKLVDVFLESNATGVCFTKVCDFTTMC